MPFSTNEQIAALAELTELVRPFWSDARFSPLGAAVLDATALPDEARHLLAHDEHMTLRLRAHYRAPIVLEVLREQRSADAYMREILLRQHPAGPPAEVGVVRIYPRWLPPAAMQEILAHARPLGDILLAYGVHTQVQPRWYFRFDAAARPSQLLQCSVCHGRVGVILCNAEPAIELLEVVPA